MRRILIGVVVALLLGACGSDDASTAAASADLQAKVAAVRDAADAGDRDAAMGALGALSQAVDAHVAAGDLDDSRAEEVRAAMAQVIRSLPAPATTTTTSTTTTTTVRDRPGKGHGDDGKKHGGDDEDDD